VAATDGEALGRSRGGLSTKIHLAVDGRGWPLSVLLTPGQAGDNPQLLNVLDAIAVHDGGPGRPRKRPDMLIADKGYAHDPTRRALRRRGIRHTIPERADQVARRAAKGSAGAMARPGHSLRQTGHHEHHCYHRHGQREHVRPALLADTEKWLWHEVRDSVPTAA
jgi:transposase